MSPRPGVKKSTVQRSLMVIVPLILAACDPKPSAPGPAGKVADVVVHVTAYVCEDGRIVRVLYPDRDTASLTLDGNTYRLKGAVSGSGARYTGDGLQWWTKGDEGMLAPLKTAEEIASNPGVRCVPPSRAAVAPPEPGTPGGLPDDRTPLDERPAKAGSAQAAATVVETYFALIESGRTEEAAKLRADGMRQDLGSYLTLGAQVGAPGRVTAAAGSLYVDVPVSIYGRYASGEAYLKGGKVVLRRADDRTGTSADARRWRIVQFQLETYPSASRPTR